MTKRQVKASYKNGDIFMTEAMQALVFDFEMSFGEARDYLER